MHSTIIEQMQGELTLQYKNMKFTWIILNVNMLKLKSNIVKTKFIQPSLNKCKAG
jgi:hypothetical protein